MSTTGARIATEILPLPRRQPGQRLFGLDWLRVAATLLVVLLHAGIPFQSHPLPGLVWATESPQRSGGIDLICWWINGFIMPLFFLISGYLAAQSCTRLGRQRFLWHRLARVGGAFVVGVVLILPLDLYAWLLGWAGAGSITLRQLQTLKFDPSLGDALWGVSHLWFLQYLFLYCLGGWAISALLQRCRGTNRGPETSPAARHDESGDSTPALAVGRLAAIFMAAVTFNAALLWYQPRIVIGFRHSWLPMWENALYYAVPFGLGWAWFRHQPRWLRGWQGMFGLAVASGVFVGMLPRLRHHVEQELMPVSDPLLPILFATFALLMSTSLFAIALDHHGNAPPRSIRYVCEASFWIYLVHHPLVALAHVDLALTRWPPPLQFTLAFVIPLLLALASYEVLVRRTWLGTLLNGRRSAQAPATAQLDGHAQPVAPPVAA